MHHFSKRINLFLSSFSPGSTRDIPCVRRSNLLIVSMHLHILDSGGGFRMKKPAFLLGCVFLLCWSSPAWAVQPHGEAEGPVVHLMAHLLLFVALLLWLYVLHTRPPDTGLSWRSLKLSLLFFLLWDMDHLFIHWFAGGMYPDIRDAGVSLVGDYFVGPRTLLTLLYYMGRFDHLLCVPGLWFFTSALRDFSEVIEKRRQSRAGQVF